MSRTPHNNQRKQGNKTPANTNADRGRSMRSAALEVAFLLSLAIIGMGLIYLLF